MVYTCIFCSFSASSTNTLLAHRLTTCSPYQNLSEVFRSPTPEAEMVVDNHGPDLPSKASLPTWTDTVNVAPVSNEPVSLENMQSKFNPLKPHQCPTCAKGFKTNDQLKAHFESIHLRQKERCKKCSNAYSNKANLANHMKKKRC